MNKPKTITFAGRTFDIHKEYPNGYEFLALIDIDVTEMMYAPKEWCEEDSDGNVVAFSAQDKELWEKN